LPKKITPVKYTSRDFARIKQDLIEYTKRYYPDTFRDFNEASFGSLMLDTVSYVGDILSFYLDYQVNESFLETAIQYDNVLKIGKQLGYKFGGASTSHGIVTVYAIVPAGTSGTGPDTDYLPIVRRGTSFISSSGAKYILNENINFSDSNNEVVVADVNGTTGLPTSYAVRAHGQVISGEIQTETVEVGAFKKFNRIQVPGKNITEILSVRDSEGHTYYEVDYLSQNTVFVEVVNQGLNQESVKTILKPIVVPRRYVVEHVAGRTFIQFGYGSEENLRSNLITDPNNVILDVHGKDYIKDTSFDPTKLTQTDKFGVVPANTSLVVSFRTNQNSSVNAAAGAITTVGKKDVIFPSVQAGAVLSSAKTSSVVSSLEVTNQSPIVGAVSYPTSEELKHRIYGNYSAQNRAVTRQDYVSMIYSMPPQLGAVKRVNIVQDSDSFKRNLNIYVISQDSSGDLVPANAILKSNIRNWIRRHKMMNDTIDILDAFIVNIGIEFSVVSHRNANKYDTLQAAQGVVATRIASTQRGIGERFYISDIYGVLRTARGVLDVTSVKLTRKVGGRYSNTTLFIDELIDPDGRFLDIPENIILEIKYPNADIKGTIL